MIERGWIVKENKPHRIIYAGTFKAKGQEWDGRILLTSKNDNSQIRPLIHNPPTEINKIPQGKCFRLVGNGWFDLHWEKPPLTASDCLAYLESILDKALTS